MRARQREWAELKLAGAVRCPGPSSPIAIDERRQLAIEAELDGVLRALVRRQPPWNLTSCHDVPRSEGEFDGKGRSAPSGDTL